MEELRKNQYASSYNLLKQAEAILRVNSKSNLAVSEYNRLYSLTMNNLGCYYKKINKPNVALNYLKNALKCEIDSKQPLESIASTKLNICAILSQL